MTTGAARPRSIWTKGRDRLGDPSDVLGIVGVLDPGQRGAFGGLPISAPLAVASGTTPGRLIPSMRTSRTALIDGVAGAGQRSLLVGLGRYRSLRLLQFAAALLRALTLNRQWHDQAKCQIPDLQSQA